MESEIRGWVYLDQNVLGQFLPDANASDLMRRLLLGLRNLGAVPVYSMTTVDECRAYGEPEKFAQILEEIGAGFIGKQDAAANALTVSFGRTRELILAPECIWDATARMMERPRFTLQLALGFLTLTEAEGLRSELLEANADYWHRFGTEIGDAEGEFAVMGLLSPTEATRQLRALLERTIHDLPLQKLDKEREAKLDRQRKRVEGSRETLKAKPVEDRVDFFLSLLDPEAKDDLVEKFPKGFWADPANRQDGNLTAFAFTLYGYGLVGHRKARSGDVNARQGRFLAQFRDCQHIEEAARCGLFVTFDKDAANLAEAVYAYAGVPTTVVQVALEPS
ncbi:MAG: hypothetical protein ACK4GW_15365 [Pseudorhodobacter sp.]